MQVQGRKSILFFAVVLGCLAAAGPLIAQEYSFRYYGVEEGLTNLAVKVLFQDRAGFLWAGTENGVFRYDGQRFQRYGSDEGLPHEVVLSLGEAPDGSVMAGYRGGLYRQNGHRFEAVPLAGAGIDSYSAIQFDGKNRTFIGTDRGLIVATSSPEGSGLTLRTIPTPAGADAPETHGVFLEAGAVWYGCGSGLCRMIGEKVAVYGEAAGLPKGNWMSIRRDGRGDLWVHDLKKFAVMRYETTSFDPANPGFPQTAGGGQLEVDAGGRLLVPTIEGLTISENGRFRTVGKSENLHSVVYAVLQDREGSIWLGLAGHGLARWRGYREWEGFTGGSGLSSELIYAILPLENGTVLAGTEDGLFAGRKIGDRWTWKRHPAVGRMPVHALQLEQGGSIWIGTERNGAARIDSRSSRIQWFRQEQGLTGISPFALALDRSHRIWAATEKGLFVAQLSDKVFHRVEDVPAVNCWAVTEGPDGRILVGTSAGLFWLEGEKWRRISTADGLRHDIVLSVAEGKPGEVWVGYWFSGNVTRIRIDGGHLSMTDYGSAQGLRGEMSYFLAFDARGRLWVGTDQGVKVWDGAVWKQYNHEDGLIWDDCDLQGFAADADGAVWIGTSGGLAHFTPASSTREAQPPAVVFTKLTVGKTNIEKSSPISVGYTSNSLMAGYSALTFVREGSRLYRYRLQPLFSDWRETSLSELQFPGLPPNDYHLEVQARDGSGAWSKKAAEFAFEIRLPWWRRWWFFLLLVLTIAGVLLGILDRKNKRHLRMQRELEAQRELYIHATCDDLTGLWNRRMILELMDRELGRTRREHQPFAVAIVDLDLFKKVNDTHGHTAGDTVLHETAVALQSQLRSYDFIGRYGGEEFLVLLPGCTTEEAFAIAGRLRTTIAAVPVHLAGVEVFVTVSIGLASSADSGLDSAALIEAADEALYRAKAGGRDRVEVFGEPVAIPG
jgi:diguanylate cyclase (GGDEF)-like protein